MKILHVIDSMDRKMGGPPQVCAHLMSRQCNDHEISIGTYSDFDTCGAIQEIDGLKVHQVSASGFVEKIIGRNSKAKLASVIREQDIVHIHNMWEPILVAAASIAKEQGIPYVVTPHGMLDPWCMRQKSWKKKLALMAGRKAMLQNAKFIHVLNSEEQEGIEKLGIKNRFEVVANGVALEDIDPFLSKSMFETEYAEFANKPFVLFLSRLHYKKGLDILGEVAKDFCSKYPEWSILVAGPDGGAQAAFEKQIQSFGLSDQVKLLGPIYGNLKYSLLSACRFFCLPSRQEGFSVAILEAMSASKPVAITTACHFEEVRERECGMVDVLDPKLIAKSFSSLAESTSLVDSMGRNARQLIEEKYTWEKINEQLVEKYES